MKKVIALKTNSDKLPMQSDFWFTFEDLQNVVSKLMHSRPNTLEPYEQCPKEHKVEEKL